MHDYMGDIIEKKNGTLHSGYALAGGKMVIAPMKHL